MKFLERFWNGCGHCHGAESCPLLQAHENAGPFGHGASMAGAAATVFLLPIVTVIAGASAAEHYLAGPSFASVGFWQCLGGAMGLVVGVAIAKLVIHLLRPSKQTRTGVK